MGLLSRRSFPRASVTAVASLVYQAAIAVNIPTYSPAWVSTTFQVNALLARRKSAIHIRRNVVRRFRLALKVPNDVTGEKIAKANTTNPMPCGVTVNHSQKGL